MASASCKTTAIEFEIKLILPHKKSVPLFRMAAVPKVRSRTGTSA
ncbi:hypothetical protein EVA_09305 [gut metagenome]|uniref:Uncharacterized protein n=1 Tax=gut metagenome TaxID=749906 RepID=J9CR08_9ZZZZ